MERHTSWESQAGGLMDLLWQHKNLDQEDAEKDEAGTGHVVLECWQCSGSVLGRKRAPWEMVDGCCGEGLHTAASMYLGQREACELQRSAKTSYGGHLRQSASSLQMNLSGLHGLQCMSACTGNPLVFKRVKPGRKEAPQKGSVGLACALLPYSRIMWGKGNGFPSSNTFKWHQENARKWQT